MRLRALTIAATVALLAFSGCVSSKKYAALSDRARLSETRLQRFAG